MGLTRIVQGRSATLSHTFYSGGVATDPSPDSATLTITRADGTTLVPAGSVDNSAAGVAKITLTPAETASLDTLTLRWVASFGGQSQTFIDTVEIAGDVLFRIDQARTALGDPTYDEAKINEARTYAETELENALGYALVPRYARDTKSGAGGRVPLRLRPYLRTVRDVTVGGTALSSTDLAALAFDESGFLYGYAWTAGYGNVVVGYEHGLDTPPSGASRAALALALDYLSDDTGSSIDPRAESIVTVDGTIRLRAGGQFNAAGVNEWVAANRIPALA